MDNNMADNGKLQLEHRTSRLHSNQLTPSARTMLQKEEVVREPRGMSETWESDTCADTNRSLPYLLFAEC